MTAETSAGKHSRRPQNKLTQRAEPGCLGLANPSPSNVQRPTQLNSAQLNSTQTPASTPINESWKTGKLLTYDISRRLHTA